MSCAWNEQILENILEEVEQLGVVDLLRELNMNPPMNLIECLDIQKLQWKLAYQRFEEQAI